jgi:hypothetical protein
MERRERLKEERGVGEDERRGGQGIFPFVGMG